MFKNKHMKYSIGDSVYVIKTGEVKKIIDFEVICEIELYYMSDSTSFPCNMLTKFKNIVSREELEKKIFDNKDVIMGLIDVDKAANNLVRYILKNSNNNLP